MAYGANEGRDPNRLFSTVYYRERYLPSEWATTINPLVHYLTTGWLKAFDPHPLFDTDWYLMKNPDVASTRTPPLIHYLHSGAAEGRDPHPPL
jgi:hypothetical protein